MNSRTFQPFSNNGSFESPMILIYMNILLVKKTDEEDITPVYGVPDLDISVEMEEKLKELFVKITPIFENRKEGIEYISREFGPYLAYMFEVPSLLFMELPVKLMLLFYFDDHENIRFFRSITKKIIHNLQDIEDLNLALYIGTEYAESESYDKFKLIIEIMKDGLYQIAKKHETFRLGFAEILIIGNKEGGKTTMVDNLMNGPSGESNFGNLTSTIMHSFFERIDFRVIDTCCKEHVLEILDGHPLNARRLPQGIVYVIDVTRTGKDFRESVKNFRYWLDYLSNKYPAGKFAQIPMLIIFNKTDLKPVSI